jgi:hypothetical protein
MSKQAISVTLDADNISWLKGRATAIGARSLSDLLDQIVSAARKSGSIGPSRSVVGTVIVDESDPNLDHADTHVRALFDRWLRRPSMIREPRPEYGSPKSKKRRRARS